MRRSTSVYIEPQHNGTSLLRKSTDIRKSTSALPNDLYISDDERGSPLYSHEDSFSNHMPFHENAVDTDQDDNGLFSPSSLKTPSFSPGRARAMSKDSDITTVNEIDSSPRNRNLPSISNLLSNVLFSKQVVSEVASEIPNESNKIDELNNNSNSNITTNLTTNITANANTSVNSNVNNNQNSLIDLKLNENKTIATTNPSILFRFPDSVDPPPSEVSDFCLPLGAQIRRLPNASTNNTSDNTRMEILYGNSQSKRSGLLLIEAKVLVIGQEPGIVSCSVLGLKSLLAPLAWAGPLIPVIPLKHAELIEAPVPLLAGVSQHRTGVSYNVNSLLHEETNKAIDLISVHVSSLLSMAIARNNKPNDQADMNKSNNRIRDPAVVQPSPSKNTTFSGILSSFISNQSTTKDPVVENNIVNSNSNNVISEEKGLIYLSKQKLIGDSDEFINKFLQTQMFAEHTSDETIISPLKSLSSSITTSPIDYEVPSKGGLVVVGLSKALRRLTVKVESNQIRLLADELSADTTTTDNS
eukprot:gene19492-25378_t